TVDDVVIRDNIAAAVDNHAGANASTIAQSHVHSQGCRSYLRNHRLTYCIFILPCKRRDNCNPATPRLQLPDIRVECATATSSKLPACEQPNAKDDQQNQC